MLLFFCFGLKIPCFGQSWSKKSKLSIWDETWCLDKSKYAEFNSSFSCLRPELSVLGKKPIFSDEEPISCKTDLNIIIIIITITIIIIIIVIIIIIITITITIIIIYYYLFIYYLLSRGERVQTCSRCSDEILKVLLKKNYY